MVGIPPHDGTKQRTVSLCRRENRAARAQVYPSPRFLDPPPPLFSRQVSGETSSLHSGMRHNGIR